MAAELKTVDDHKPKKIPQARTAARVAMILRQRRATRAARFAEVQERACARVLGFGAGVNSVAQLLREPHVYDYVIFADVGAEEPPTYEYIEKHVRPFCKEKGIHFEMVRSHLGTLEDHCRERKILPIKARRWCTDKFKIRPVNHFIRETVGATAEHPVILDLCFTIDEARRAAADDSVQHAYQNYPLVYDQITRAGCVEVIQKHGWPLPVKSACDFCMFHNTKHFARLLAENPKRYAEIMDMEESSTDFPKRTLISSTSLRGLKAARASSLVVIDDDEESTGGCESAWCSDRGA